MSQDALHAAKAAAEELSLEDLRALRQWITLEQEPKLEAAPFVAQEQAQIIRDLREQGVVPRPEATTYEEAETSFKELGKKKALSSIPTWLDPKGKFAAGYEKGDVVVYKSRVYMSIGDTINTVPIEEDTAGNWTDITPQLEFEVRGGDE